MMMRLRTSLTVSTPRWFVAQTQTHGTNGEFPPRAARCGRSLRGRVDLRWAGHATLRSDDDDAPGAGTDEDHDQRRPALEPGEVHHRRGTPAPRRDRRPAAPHRH